MLDQLITTHRQEIIARSRAKAAARAVPSLGDGALDESIPSFLDQLSEVLRQHTSSPSQITNDQMSNAAAIRQGGDLFRRGFNVSQVVHGYGDVCQAVTELALDRALPIATDDFRIFNRCLDEAIVSAVTEYERQLEERISSRGAERLGVFAHELRNSLSAALLAFSVVKRGVVGLESSTGAVLHRSLLRLRELIDRSLSGVRLESKNLQLQRLSVSDAIEEVSIAAAVDASSRGISLVVPPVPGGLEVNADRHLLVGAIQNIVQNALKFTPRNGHVALVVRELNGQVLVAVQDECGGLPPGKSEELFGSFQQRGLDRSGLGLGLSISRASAAAMGGTLEVRDLPGKGCVFTLALPSLAGTDSAIRPSARELVRPPRRAARRAARSEDDLASTSSWADEGGAD
jgi:signal transduction histidine kinase